MKIFITILFAILTFFKLSICLLTDCLRWMTHACTCPGYYIYSGSLTFPPYNECVTWIIVPKAIKISSYQVYTCIPVLI